MVRFAPLAGLAAACALLLLSRPSQAASEAPREIPLQELLAWVKGGDAVTLVDASRPETRDHLGQIPNALLIGDPKTYDPKEELPHDKATRLVFYCAYDHSTPAQLAAARAQSAGYTNVWIFREGLSGWKQAGQAIVRGTAR